MCGVVEYGSPMAHVECLAKGRYVWVKAPQGECMLLTEIEVSGLVIFVLCSASLFCMQGQAIAVGWSALLDAPTSDWTA